MEAGECNNEHHGVWSRMPVLDLGQVTEPPCILVP